MPRSALSPESGEAAQPASSQERWGQALEAAAVFAVDPVGIGGVILRSRPDPLVDRWLKALAECLPEGSPMRRMPLHIDDGRLLGGLDLAATLRAGRPVAQRGLLAEADLGVIVLPGAERIPSGLAARLAAAIDTGEARADRDGLGLRQPARFGTVALDEGIGDDESLPAALAERLGIVVDLSGFERAVTGSIDLDEVSQRVAPAGLREAVEAARRRLAGIRIPLSLVESAATIAFAWGIDSLRMPSLALRVARAVCALDARDEVNQDDLASAIAWVLAPRATQLPAAPATDTGEPQAPPPPPHTSQGESDDTQRDPAPEPPAPDDAGLAASGEPGPAQPGPTGEMLIEAALARLPPGLLERLQSGTPPGGRGRAGQSGAVRRGGLRGRPVGIRVGTPGAGSRLNLVETLRAAAPWQRLRRGSQGADGLHSGLTRRVRVEPSDFRVSRFAQRSRTTTIFVVDASGSSALNRLAEAKGAVELLLADCYIRRDRVALVAFRGQKADLELPPTRSLVRAKRSLAGLPGGGATPLASGLEVAHQLAASLVRGGDTPVIVVLTDGRANIARDGEPGRARAWDDAIASARSLRQSGHTALLIDTAPRTEPQAARLAHEMGARYLRLPHADSRAVSQAVRVTVAGAG